VETSEFIEIAHRHLIFQEADIPPQTPLLLAIKRIGILVSAGESIFIEGPVGSGKRQLADAVTEFRGTRLILLDCTDDRQCPSDGRFKDDDNGLIIFIPDVEKATEQHRRWILGLFQSHRQSGPLYLLTATENHQSSAAVGRFLGTLRIRLGYNRVVLPSLHERPWDIPSLVVNFLARSSVEYITYNAFDFLVSRNWQGGIPELGRAVRFFAAASLHSDDPAVITWRDIKEYFPSVKSDRSLPIDAKTGQLAPVTSYETGKTCVPDPEASTWLRRQYFFMWLTGSRLEAEPNLTAWACKLDHLDSWKGWLKDEAVGREFLGKTVSIAQTEEFLLDVEKMRECFDGILPDNSSSPPVDILQVGSTSSPPPDPDFNAFLVMSKNTIATSSTGYDDHPMAKPLRIAWQVSRADEPVLILGETGTGKELFARAIHSFVHGSKQPFIPVNCAGFSANLVEDELYGHEKGAFTGAAEKRIGKFQQADGGTLFLDEIGDMSLETQAKILRVIEDKLVTPVGGTKPTKVKVRIVAATNRDLIQDVASDHFRNDLFGRLSNFSLHLPPLRERKDDVLLLFAYSWREERRKKKTFQYIEAGVLEFISQYSWPRNVRELKALVLRATSCIADDTWRFRDLKEHLPEGQEAADTYAQIAGQVSTQATRDMHDICQSLGWEVEILPDSSGKALPVGRVGKSLSDEEIAGLIAEVERSGSFSEAARRTGRSRNTVAKYWKQMRPDDPPPR
jgi:DNA-binding NtrC family response regulator